PLSGNSSPVASMPPIITVPIQPTTGFLVTASDANNDTLHYRLSTVLEMFGPNPITGGILAQPPGLRINASTGQVTWTLSALTAAGFPPTNGDLWTAQFMVEDLDTLGNVKSKVPIDVILKLQTVVGHPPTLTFIPPGPLSVQVGATVTFDV